MKNTAYFPCELIDTGFDYRIGIESKNLTRFIPLFEQQGIRPNGKSWEQLVRFLVHTNIPNMSHVIDYESDNKGMETSLRSKKDQLKIATLIHHSCKDTRQFQRLLQEISF